MILTGLPCCAAAVQDLVAQKMGAQREDGDALGCMDWIIWIIGCNTGEHALKCDTIHLRWAVHKRHQAPHPPVASQSEFVPGGSKG